MSTASYPRPEVTPLESSPLPDRRIETIGSGIKATLVNAGVVPVAGIRIVVRAGSADVPAGQTWLDRLVHDYLREGTEELDSGSFAAALAELGGSLYVSGDEHTTTISTEVPSENAPAALKLLASVARTPRFPASAAERLRDDLERTRAVVGTQPGWLAHAAFRSELYGSHPYGTVLPAQAEIAGLTMEAAREFWTRRAGGSNVRLMVAGLFDADAILEAATESLSGWGGEEHGTVAAPTTQTERIVRYVERPGAEQSTLQIGLRVPAPGHPDYVPLEVLNSLLGGSFYSRITLNIREDKGYTYSPRSSISSRPGDAYWAEAADVTTNVTGASIREILKEIERLRSESPAEDELRGIINYVSGSFVIRQATPGGILNHLEFLDLHGLDTSYSANYVARVREVTPADVQRLAQEYLDPAKMPIVVVGDQAQVQEQVAEFGPTA